ncbi:kinetochore-associated protein Mtw1p [Trichomonascus vanleenenianus]|uniref:MIND complex subunit MTW1 n=1 Tax=Trichomonascus vanleenenianus TaxID=2268995 RepID=UPI003ECA7668
MSSDMLKSTAILTEHLGYAPIALIDDIINAVNEILYKCTAAMETFLTERYGNDSTSSDASQIPADEIELGTAKLETLLESVVDRCFDKFELYVLRNLLVIPPELISGGWIRLGHHTGVDFTEKPFDELDRKLALLRQQMYMEKKLNRWLKMETKKSSKLIGILEGYQSSLEFLSNPGSPEAKQAFNEVVPICDSLRFLSSQVGEMIKSIQAIQQSVAGGGVSLAKAMPSTSRDEYLDVFSKRAMDINGINTSGVLRHRSEQEGANAQKIVGYFT